ncbi:MAG: MATE family efflux transporter, partial [Haemophilus parainfluenzae]|nr:MATE family efflux transporter [Haemophilus parainfluenzae]
MADVTMNYLRAMVWGLPAYLLLINFRCLNDGIAKTKPAMVITFMGLMLNIPLNYMFIYGKFGAPALGGVGCGVATAIVNWAMAILMITYSAKNYNERSLKVFEKIIEKPDIKTLKKLTALGLPIAIALCSEVSLFALSSLLLSPLGADVVASHQIALNTSAVAFMFPMSIAMAATILVAQELGNHAPQKAKIMAHAAIILGLIAASVLALVIWVFSEEIAALIVGDNATVIALSGGLLAMAAIYQFSDSVQVVVSGILRGYKDTKIILYITLLAYWGVGIPVGYILSRTDWIVPSIGAKGFWVAFIIALTIAAALLFIRMRKIQSQSDEAIIQQLERLK